MTGLVTYEKGVLLQRTMRCATCGSGLLMPHVGEGRFQLRCLTDPDHTTMTAPKNTRKLVNPDGTLKEFDMTTQKPVETTTLVRYQTDHGQLELSVKQIQQYICPDATPEEAYLFLCLCQVQRLNPLIKEAYLIVYTGKDGVRRVSMVVARDVFIRRAEAHPQYDGFEAGIIVELPEGNVENLEGAVAPPGGLILGGWAKIYRKDRPGPHFTTIADSEYNTGRSTWAQMKGTMNRKVALVQGFREMFPTISVGMGSDVVVGEPGEIVEGEIISDTGAPAPPATPAPASPSQERRQAAQGGPRGAGAAQQTASRASQTHRNAPPTTLCALHANALLHIHTGLKQMVHRLQDNRFCNGKGQTWSPTGEAEAQQPAPDTGDKSVDTGAPPSDGFPADLPSVAQDEAALRAAVAAKGIDWEAFEAGILGMKLPTWLRSHTIAQALALLQGARMPRGGG